MSDEQMILIMGSQPTAKIKFSSNGYVFHYVDGCSYIDPIPYEQFFRLLDQRQIHEWDDDPGVWRLSDMGYETYKWLRARQRDTAARS